MEQNRIENKVIPPYTYLLMENLINHSSVNWRIENKAEEIRLKIFQNSSPVDIKYFVNMYKELSKLWFFSIYRIAEY